MVDQLRLLASRVRFPAGAFAIFSVSAKASVTISLSLSLFLSPFLFLSLALPFPFPLRSGPFVCSKNATSHLSR